MCILNIKFIVSKFCLFARVLFIDEWSKERNDNLIEIYYLFLPVDWTMLTCMDFHSIRTIKNDQSDKKYLRDHPQIIPNEVKDQIH
jgi:hypothetical protein